MNALVSFEKQCREIPALVLRLLSLMLVTAVCVLFLKIVCQIPSLVLKCLVRLRNRRSKLFTRKMPRLRSVLGVRGSMKTGVGALSDSRFLTRGHV